MEYKVPGLLLASIVPIRVAVLPWSISLLYVLTAVCRALRFVLILLMVVLSTDMFAFTGLPVALNEEGQLFVYGILMSVTLVVVILVGFSPPAELS